MWNILNTKKSLQDTNIDILIHAFAPQRSLFNQFQSSIKALLLKYQRRITEEMFKMTLPIFITIITTITAKILDIMYTCSTYFGSPSV